MQKEKVLSTGIIAILLLFIAASLYFFISQRKEIYPKPEESEPYEVSFKDFLGSPAVSGTLREIDLENLVLSVESYDPSTREDLIFLFKITEETVFIERYGTPEKVFVFENYSEAFNLLQQGMFLRVFVDDIPEEVNQALTVELDTSFPSPFEEADLEPF